MGMSVNPAGGRQGMEHLDADAVCAQCGTVNPEETLICKTCGNNLRDQRQMRMATEAQLEGQASKGSRRQWIGRILSLFGILLVLWAVFNLSQIEDWMIAAQTEGSATADENWFGPQAELFDNLVAELQANLPTQEEAAAAMGIASTPGGSWEGYYVLTTEDGVLGTALIRESARQPSAAQAAPEASASAGAPAAAETAEAQEGAPPVTQAAVYDIVALLLDAEVRGTAQLRDVTLTGDWNNMAVRVEGEYLPASGVVIQQLDGTFDGFGRTGLGEQGYSFTAYKLPAS